ncbi:MAG: regulatory iron-sulfur-containing complex subunit RicT [Lentisphaeria bacterium]
MKALYKVSVSVGLSYECIADCALDLQKGDQVIVRCERYLDFVSVERRCPGEELEDEIAFEKLRTQTTKGRHIEGQKIPLVLRKATPQDQEKASENEEKAKAAHFKALERIKFHALEMKLIQTHYAFDRKILVFQFSAEGRIDFRELLRDLSGLFHVRVELRQVGVRDETAILGGIGTCGRPFCCASFLPSFNSINVKMAKQQGLSLNPQNISGCCGRLKCCLQYEAEFYRNNPIMQKNSSAPSDKDADLASLQQQNSASSPRKKKKIESERHSEAPATFFEDSAADELQEAQEGSTEFTGEDKVGEEQK